VSACDDLFLRTAFRITKKPCRVHVFLTPHDILIADKVRLGRGGGAQ